MSPDVAPLTLPAHKKVPFIDRRANLQSRNNINTLMTITTIHVMRNTEFAMIQTFTNSGFSWGQTEDAVITATYYHGKQGKVGQITPASEYLSEVAYCDIQWRTAIPLQAWTGP
jgi:hypothetical protein